VQNGLFVTFVLGAWIRELGYRASTAASLDAARLAVAAKLGTLDRTGKLLTAEYGTRVHVADVIRTDLPWSPLSAARFRNGRALRHHRVVYQRWGLRRGVPRRLHPYQTRRLAVLHRSDVCIDCEQCEIVCPVDAIFKDVDVLPSTRFHRRQRELLPTEQGGGRPGPTLETAWQMVHKAHEYARRVGIAVTAAVVDEAGVPIAVGRMDGGRLADDRARGQQGLHGGRLFTSLPPISSRSAPALAEEPRRRASRAPAARGRRPRHLDGITIIGAIGVAGGSATDQDVLCCQAAFFVLETVGTEAKSGGGTAHQTTIA